MLFDLKNNSLIYTAFCESFSCLTLTLQKQVHVPMDPVKGLSKGFAFLLFTDPEDAIQAYQLSDGKSFQGRLLHVMPANPKQDTKLDEFAISQLPIKQQQKIKRKMEASTVSYKWNPLYMNMDDVISSISTRLGVPKSELIDATSSDAAVKQALAETHIIQEAKSYFAAKGVDLDSFKPGRQRGDAAILIKNFPYGTTAKEIRDLFDPHGQITRLLIPPSGTMALIEFALATQGRAAFSSLKYRRIKDSILFLEKAPKDVFSTMVQTTLPVPAKENAVTAKLSTTDILQESSSAADAMDTSTLFVRNLNFTTTTEKLKEICIPLSGFVSAKVKTKPVPKHPSKTLSMGFGFLEFRTKEDAQSALATLDGYVLEGHKLDVNPSQKVLDAGEEQRKVEKAKAAASQKTKVVVKNVPFEISKKEIRTLLGTYGKLRSVRVPKKFDSSSRGFAFAEFTTATEAANAISALRNTHLLGRRLHLEYADEDVVDAEEEIERMQKKVGSQVDKVTLQKLTGSARRKFNVEGEVDKG
jgi:multiple RNA-binding domain-containing protein 1